MAVPPHRPDDAGRPNLPQPPPAPYAPPPGQGMIVIDVDHGYSARRSPRGIYLTAPTILINGRNVPADKGRNRIPVPPGRHHVRMFKAYRIPKEHGPAEFTADVAPGQIVRLEYRAPWFILSRGALGPPPQRAHGAVAILVAVAAVVAVAVLVAVIPPLVLA